MRCPGDSLRGGKAPYRKYPVMHRMFHEEEISTPYLMWFDDDSWIDEKADDGWFNTVAAAMQSAEMIGSIWRIRPNYNQQMFIEDQPWYAGKPIPYSVQFATGGWWVIRSEILKKWKWPTPSDFHNGGDMLLGELCHQQDYRLAHFDKGVHINADHSGVCSSAKRRGISETPLGADYDRDPIPLDPRCEET